MSLRLAIFISGEGTNLRHIHQWCQEGKIDATIVGVICDKTNAGGLEWARQQQLPCACIEYTNKEKGRGEDEIDRQLREWNTEFVVLAGFMRILQQSFIARWPNAIVNLHPSLLPLYKGIRPYERAIADGQSHHGCSIHVVIEELDAGHVIAQASLPIEPDDTVQTLSARVRSLEHQLVPRIVRMICVGDIAIRNGIAYRNDSRIDGPLMLQDLLDAESGD